MTEKKIKKHTILGGSSLDRAFACPSSIVMQTIPANRVKDTSSVYAIRGDNMHQYAEDVLNRKEPSLKLGTKNREDVEGYIKFCDDIIADKAIKYFVEPKLYSKMHKEISGAIDCLIVEKNCIHVIDLKTGFAQKYPETNQLYLYALLVYENRKLLKIDDESFESIKLTIYQTTASRPARSLRIMLKHLLEFEERLKKLLTNIKSLSKVVISGKKLDINRGSHCKYCPVRDYCTLGGRGND